MDIIVEDICKVLNFIITEHKITDNGKVISTFFNIRNGIKGVSVD